MQMESGLDQGPVLLQATTPIADTDTAGILHDRLAQLGADVLADALTRLGSGLFLKPKPQSTQGVSYAHKLVKAQARLDWTLTAAELARKVRAFNPWPIAEGVLLNERLRIHQAEAIKIVHSLNPGSVVHASKSGLDIACSDGALRLLRLQRPGSSVISAADFLNARHDVFK